MRSRVHADGLGDPCGRLGQSRRQATEDDLVDRRFTVEAPGRTFGA
jgi:hypothetical protein